MMTQETPVLQAALAALGQTTGLAARVLEQELPIRQGRADALVEVAAGRRRHRFIAVVKTVDRFETPAQVKRQLAGSRAAPMLVAPHVTADIARCCRDLGLALSTRRAMRTSRVPACWSGSPARSAHGG